MSHPSQRHLRPVPSTPDVPHATDALISMTPPEVLVADMPTVSSIHQTDAARLAAAITVVKLCQEAGEWIAVTRAAIGRYLAEVGLSQHVVLPSYKTLCDDGVLRAGMCDDDGRQVSAVFATEAIIDFVIPKKLTNIDK